MEHQTIKLNHEVVRAILQAIPARTPSASLLANALFKVVVANKISVAAVRRDDNDDLRQWTMAQAWGLRRLACALAC